MKRPLVLLAIPIALFVVWTISNRGPSAATAEVDVHVDDVVAFRGTLIAQLTTQGAVQVGEQTSFEDGDSSELRFRVPPAKLGQTIQTIANLGGTITSQRSNLDVDQSSLDAVSQSAKALDECMTDLSRSATGSGKKLQDSIATCSAQSRTLTERMNNTAGATAPASLTVKLSQSTTSTTLTWIAIAVVIAGGIAVLIITIRGQRANEAINLTATDSLLSELMARRN